MTPMWIDHVVFGLLAVVFPIWGYFWLRKRKALILAGHSELRVKMYRRLVVEEWVMAAVLLIGWFALGRGSAAIGLIPQSGTPAWAGYGLAALLCVVLVLQMRSVTRQPEALEKHRKQLGGLSFILPHTVRELKAFDAVSVTAGICEEVIYRGYLIAYLMAALGSPFWVGALLSSVVFGVAHSYQGPAGIPRTAAVGGMLALLYGLTGSLWAPMLVHAVMDITSGRIAYAVVNDTTPESPRTIATAGDAVGELSS
ncbi:MAG: CPBP family intramembrane metalloprotease [Acidobacteria bacterium]|nr:CPBP family intramembrane metalloprotease [Acidobacteriota bacterium]NIQ30626.1 CPBP family intramembrane metalloprotease [Acidobacteriota bacterium]NIQ85584.1 CPBP family intramembrane metalloprotease [Acidobacteriota bacterium]